MHQLKLFSLNDYILLSVQTGEGAQLLTETSPDGVRTTTCTSAVRKAGETKSDLVSQKFCLPPKQHFYIGSHDKKGITCRKRSTAAEL